jgi:hypothetical protein
MATMEAVGCPRCGGVRHEVVSKEALARRFGADEALIAEAIAADREDVESGEVADARRMAAVADTCRCAEPWPL